MKPIEALALTALLAASCSDAGAAGPPDVVLVCIDTLRADHLGCYGHDRRDTSPALDALAAESIVFRDASATAGWTKPSVPSFLTGTFPSQHGVYEGSSKDGAGRISHLLPRSAVTLAEVFAERGYRTGAFVQNAQLRLGQGLEQGFGTYEDGAGDAREIRWRALDWLADAPDDRPFFLYLHFLDAHWPYPVPDAYATRFAAPEAIERFRTDDWKALRDAINDGEAEFGQEDRAALEALYDGAIRYVDDQLGRLFAELDRRGLWSDAVVAVVSDHGEEFGEHGRIGHGHGLWENLLAVPWILRVPGRGPARVDAPVSLVDLFPTLLAASGIAAPRSSGVDRLASPKAAGDVLAEHKAPDRYFHSLRDGDLKVVRHFERDLDLPAGAWPLAVGERWEVELERAGSGELVATELEPAGDDEGEPAELKGVLTALAADRLAVGGVDVRIDDATEVRRSDDTTDLAVGVLVKLDLAASADGLVARRIKLYPPDTPPDFELRGPIEALRGTPTDGALVLAGIELRTTPSTELEDRPAHRRLTHDDVQDFLTGDLRATDETSVEAWHVERAIVSQAETGAPLDGRARALATRLERAAATYAHGRIYSTTDRTALAPEDVEQLEAIGYVE